MTRRAVFHEAGSYDDGAGPLTSFPSAVSSVFGRTGAILAVTGDYYGAVGAALTGATQASRYVGATASGAPASGTFVKGDWVVAQDGHIWICTTGGIPGTWADIGGGASPTFGTPAIVLGTAAAAGSINEVIRRDATIVAFDATVPSTQAFGDSAATGSAAVAARRDHKHAMPANPVVEFDYVARSTDLTVAGTEVDFIVGNSVSYDGSTRVKIEVWASAVDGSGSASTMVVLCRLYDGSTALNRIADVRGTNTFMGILYGATYLTPSAGSHTYKVTAVGSATGTVLIHGGAAGGGAGTYAPAFLRITEA